MSSFYEDMKAKEVARAGAVGENDAGSPPAATVAAGETHYFDEDLDETTGVAMSNSAPIELLNFEADLLENRTPIRLATAPADNDSKPKARPTASTSTGQASAKPVETKQQEQKHDAASEADSRFDGSKSSEGNVEQDDHNSRGMEKESTDLRKHEASSEDVTRLSHAEKAIPSNQNENDTAESQLSQAKKDIAAKQQYRPTVATVPGAVSVSKLSEREQDILTKQGHGIPAAVQPGAVAVGISKLSQLEDDISAKSSERSTAVVVLGAVGVSSLSQLEQDIAAKQQAGHVSIQSPGVGTANLSRLSQMEQEVAAKQQGRIGRGAVLPGVAGITQQQETGSELTAMEDAVTRKIQIGGTNSGRAELSTMENALAQKTGGLAGSPPAMFGEITEGSNLVQMEGIPKREISSFERPLEHTKTREPEQAPKNQLPLGGALAADSGPDVEYGLHDPNDQNNEGLLVAKPVTEENEYEFDPHIQPAFEYDVDAKPPIYRQRRFRLYAFLAFFALVAAAVVAVIGVVLSDNNQNDSSGSAVPYRETLGIRDRVQRLVGEEELSNPDSAYSKALEWITHNDTMELVPESVNFVQRYIAVYFYLATTENGEWKSCNPPKEGAPDFCSFAQLTGVEPLMYQEISWTRWLTGRHECAWAGITCDEELQLRSIELSGQELSGPFPTGIKYIPFLQSIVLNWGSLYGTLPSDLFEMKHLVNVELHENKFSGSIPEEWWSARNLGRLNLGGNELTGTISTQVGNMRDLRGLYLYNNHLKGRLPTQLGELKALTYLYLNGNQLEGSIPSEIIKMDSLSQIWLYKNSLTGSIPDEIGLMSEKLNDLRLFKNENIGGDLPDSFYELTNMWRIDLRDCKFTGSLSPALGNFTQLAEARLSNNLFTGPLPTEISNWVAIERIELTGNDITGTIPQEFCERRENDAFDIRILEADCREINGTETELECSCCTLCCDSNGAECVVP